MLNELLRAAGRGSITMPVNLTRLEFTLSMNGSGSAGSFYKAIDNDWYYKLSYPIGNGTFCYESVNEVLASRLCSLCGFLNAGYELVYAKIKLLQNEYLVYLCKSKNYKGVGENRVTLETYCTLNDIDHNNIANLSNKPFFNDLLNMILIDYIINNRDRHGVNIELLLSANGERLSPIYDCGSSLLAPLQYNKERIDSYDILSDGPVNNYLISIMWKDVLNVLKSYGVKVPVIDLGQLQYSDLYCAFGNDSYILDKEIVMIKERYNHAKEVLNS